MVDKAPTTAKYADSNIENLPQDLKSVCLYLEISINVFLLIYVDHSIKNTYFIA